MIEEAGRVGSMLKPLPSRIYSAALVCIQFLLLMALGDWVIQVLSAGRQAGRDEIVNNMLQTRMALAEPSLEQEKSNVN